jgi:uncharacterized protein YgiM (DUF1202 family)
MYCLDDGETLYLDSEETLWGEFPRKTSDLPPTKAWNSDSIKEDRNPLTSSSKVKPSRNPNTALLFISIILAIGLGSALTYILTRPEQQKQQAINLVPTPQASLSPPAPSQSPTPRPAPSVTRPPIRTMTTSGKYVHSDYNSVYVRKEPNLDSEVIAVINKGQRMEALSTSAQATTYKGITSTWTRVRILDQSLEGWVWSFFLKPDDQ